MQKMANFPRVPEKENKSDDTLVLALRSHVLEEEDQTQVYTGALARKLTEGYRIQSDPGWPSEVYAPI